MPSLISLSHNGHVQNHCGAKCYNATIVPCTCICMGLNHGVGRAAAIERTRRDGLKAIAAFVAEHPYAEAYRVRIHLPPPPIKQPMLF